MVHVAAPKWNDGHERAIDREAERVSQPRQHDFLRRAFAQHGKAREV